MQHFIFVNWSIGEFVVSFFDVTNKTKVTQDITQKKQERGNLAEKRTKVKHIIPIILRTKLTEIIGSTQKKLFGENTAKKGEENQEYNDRDQTIILEEKNCESTVGNFTKYY